MEYSVIQRARKFGIRIALMTSGFRLYSILGAEKDGNYLLRGKQYEYDKTDIAKRIVDNKIENQIRLLKKIRYKSDEEKEAIETLKYCKEKLATVSSINEIMAYEGLASKGFFKIWYSMCNWKGRQPRLKRDIVNSTLDIGYTILFAYVEALLSAFGFDTFCGVLHRKFYMRKSLVCDIIEPFRCLIDSTVRNAYNLGQIKDEHFILVNGQYQLRWEHSKAYTKFLVQPLVDSRVEIFEYIQNYYRCFMKGKEISDYPMFLIGGKS